MPAISITDLNNAKLDVDHLAAVATSTALTVADRLGNTKRTLAGLRDQYPNAEPAAATATAQAGIATTQAGLATTAKTAAEAARDAINTTGKVFTFAELTAGAAISGTTSGQQFSVLSDDLMSYAIYRNESGVAVIKSPLRRFDTTDVIARAQVHAVAIGLTDAERIAAFVARGVFFDLQKADYLMAATVKASLNSFTQLVVARSAAALVQTAAGSYASVAANLLRVSDKGALLEFAATNLHTSPSTLSGTGWAATGQSITTGVSGPDGGTGATTIVQTGTTDPGRTYTSSLAIGTYTFSFVLKREDLRYQLITFTGAGLTGGTVQGNVIDWDAPGKPTFTAATGLTGFAGTVTTLSGGFYRFNCTVTTLSTASLAVRIQSTSDASYANRGLGGTTNSKVVTFWHMQVEAGTVSSSPILTAGATRPADVATLDITGVGVDGGDTIVISYDGGSSTFLRSTLASINSINLVTDGGGAWLTKYIIKITLIPAAGASYRTGLQADNDRVAALIAGAVRPLRSMVQRLGQAAGLAPIRLVVDPANDRISPTDNGTVPYLVTAAGVYYWNGQIFGTESAMFAAAGGSIAGNVRVLENYTAPDAVDIMGGVTFASDKGGFTYVSTTATTDLVGGKLRMTSTGPNAAFSRSINGYSGKALKFTMRGKRGTDGSVTVAYSRFNPNLGVPTATDNISNTTETSYSVIATPLLGAANYYGAVHVGGTIGTSDFDDPTLKEIAPAQGFPNGNFWVLLDCTMPATLPASTEVIWQGDTGSDRDRVRVDLRSAGEIFLTRVTDFATSSVVTFSLQIGTVTAGQSVKIAFGVNRTGWRGAVAGAGVEADLNGAIGFSSVRIGRSFAGEFFSGATTAHSVYAGMETLAWMKRITAATLTSRVWHLDGDSYMEGGSTGIGLMLEDLGYAAINHAVGGSTSAQQSARIVAATDIAALPWMRWDGSPNGHTDGQIAIELAEVAAEIAAKGHNRWLHVRSGQIYTGSIAQYNDMTSLYTTLGQMYGAEHTYDAAPVVQRFAIKDPANSGYANDQADIAAGRYPRSTLYDAVHLRPDVRRAVALDMQAKLDAVLKL